MKRSGQHDTALVRALAREAEPQSDEEKKALGRIVMGRAGFRTHLLLSLEMIRVVAGLATLDSPPARKPAVWVSRLRTKARRLKELAADLKDFCEAKNSEDWPPDQLSHSKELLPESQFGLLRRIKKEVSRQGTPEEKKTVLSVGSAEMWDSFLSMQQFAIAQIAALSDAYVKWADFFSDLSRKSKRRKRQARPETQHIRDLIKFVEQKTGKPHLAELAILLQRPLADTGVTAARLRAVQTLKSKKQPA